jgi:hypothetical protein
VKRRKVAGPGPPPVPIATGPVPPRPDDCTGPDDYYDPALERWVHYATAEERQKLQEGGGAVLTTPTEYWRFDSMSLPRNYTYHKEAGGSFNPDGSCRFENRAQVERTIDLANSKGERIVYPGRGGLSRHAE